MVSKKLQILNKLGLHARAAAKVSGIALRYSHTAIVLERRGMKCDAKLTACIMMLAASRGTWITIFADGEDEEQAIAAREALIADRFGEVE